MSILIWEKPVITSNPRDHDQEETGNRFMLLEVIQRMKCTYYLKDVLLNLVYDEKNFTVLSPSKETE